MPIFYGETLIGIAKVVAGPETEEHRFSVAVQALELTVSRVCQDFHVASLTEEMNGLRRQVADLQKVRGSSRSILKGSIGTDAARAERLPAGQAGSLVDRTLTYLARHHLDPGLSLAEVSRAVGSNGKYLTRLFTRNVGQHMHAYILGLRVQHACRLLLSTDAQVKTIAYESGFRGPERFRRAFREHVGVSPAAYRRIFTGS